MKKRKTTKIRTLLDHEEIRRFRRASNNAIKELDGASVDLEAAGQSAKTGEYKWATIQAYHSMIHSARALLYHMGYREQNPRGLLEALNQLYEREIISEMLQDFSDATNLTEQLHNGHPSSETSTKTVLESATEFLEQAARILAAPREWFENPASPRPKRKSRRN